MICRNSIVPDAANSRAPEATALKGCRPSGAGQPASVVGPQVFHRRRGSLMVEMVVCTLMLSVVAAVLAPGIHAIHAQRKATRFDTYALMELNNQAALLQDATLSKQELSAWFSDRYPEAELTVEIVASEPADDALLDDDATAVRLTIARPSADARPDVSRSLVVWMPQKGDSE